MYVTVKPLRKVALTGILGDVECRLPAGHPYADPDKVTHTHEGCHGVNARIRNDNQAQIGLYMLKDKAFTIPKHPNFTLAQLAAKITKRGKLFKLYLQDQQRWWNDEPLYVLDEMTAYTVGGLAGFEMGLTDRGVESRENAKEMWLYGRAAQRMAKAQGYEYQAKFDAFMEDFHRYMLHPLLKA
jgi:hypothetical protein